MNNKNILKKIIEVFATVETVETPEVVEAKFVDVKAQDGRIMRINSMEVESPVQEVTEDGLMDVEDSTVILEDGDSLVIEGGMIKEIIEAEVEEVVEEATEEMEAEEMEAEVEATEEIVEVVEEATATEEDEMLDTILKQLSEMIGQFEALKAENAEIKIELAKIADSPSASSTQTEIRFSDIKTEKFKSPLHKMLADKKK